MNAGHAKLADWGFTHLPAITLIVFAAVFTAIIFTYYRGDRKYSPASIHNYPPDIQEEYFKTHKRVDVSYRSKKVILTKAYHQKWFHAKGMLFPGIIFALIPAALVGWLVTLIR